MDKNSDVSGPQPQLWDNPNKYARAPAMEIYDSFIRFHGYQEFILTRDSLFIRDDPALEKKLQLLTPYLNEHYLAHRSLLDLGANAGFFCFLAIQKQAESAVAIDMDSQYTDMIRTAIEKFQFPNIRVFDTNITEYVEAADITLALALVHWIFSCTALYGNLDAVVQKLSLLTKYMLIVEWVEPTDPAIEFFHHLDWNSNHITAAYNIDAFEKALAHHFPYFQMFGEVSITRRLYIACKTDQNIDLSGDMPILYPAENILSRRCLTVFNGIEYWSCVYDTGDKIIKQANADLARHEYNILSKFNSGYFPGVYCCNDAGNYATVTLEKIKGRPLYGARAELSSSPAKFSEFAIHCLTILDELARKGVTHRDIRMSNLILRDGIPVLLDFGWAIASDSVIFTPFTLGAEGKPPDNSYCDIYSMGLVLQAVNNHRYPLFDRVIEIMTEADISLRIRDLKILRALFSHVTEMMTNR